MEDFVRENWPLLIPLILVQLGLMIFALADLVRRSPNQVTGSNKLLWAVVVIVVNTVGPIIYFVAGRKD